MKVTDVDVFTIAVPFKYPERWAVGSRLGCANVLIKVTTDTGLVGWGEASGGSGGTVEVVRAAVEASLPFVLGLSPFAVEELRRSVYQLGRWRNLYRVANLALAAFDTAFYDLAGKACDVPVHALLGGAVRDRISFYGYVLQGDSPAMAERAEVLIAAGFRVLYIKIGWDLEHDVETLRAVREAVGPGPRIRIDANEALQPSEAITWIQALAPFGLEFVEQPTPANDLAGMRRVRQAVSVPIAANQGLWSAEDLM